MQEKSDLGSIIDSTDEEFNLTIINYNVGTLSNLKVLLEQVFLELKVRKDLIIRSKSISEEDRESSVKGLYSEMQKVEDKFLILKSRIEELTPKVFDTEIS